MKKRMEKIQKRKCVRWHNGEGEKTSGERGGDLSDAGHEALRARLEKLMAEHQALLDQYETEEHEVPRPSSVALPCRSMIWRAPNLVRTAFCDAAHPPPLRLWPHCVVLRRSAAVARR